MRRAIIAISFFVLLSNAQVVAQELHDYNKVLIPILSKKCYPCHNTNKEKGGVNLENYAEKDRLISDGELWLKVVHQIKTREMPPKSEGPLSMHDYTTLVDGINSILETSLQEKNPGRVTIRRLSHNEYHYTILDLVGVDFDARSYFPSDGSGGGGFDNQGGALFFTPLKLERYYDAADSIVTILRNDESLWKKIVPVAYEQAWYERLINWIKSIFSNDYDEINSPGSAAEEVIIPFASKAYRRFLKENEKEKLVGLFKSVYAKKDSLSNPARFDESIAESIKTVLISPNFLYKVEEEPEKEGAYPLSHFEVANRLSYFLWSSMPDQELFNLAYTGRLHDTAVLEAQVRRMLADPKAKRFAETFSTQWLGINKLIDNQPIADPDKYPEFDMPLRLALYRETVEYFYYVLTNSKNMLELINSNYTFANNKVADYYGLEGVTDNEFKKVPLTDSSRGGVLGMGSVLATTSFPLRTSPVNRGKWVLEQLLGISPPPPPPVVAELTEDPKAHAELGLKKLLLKHRSDPACRSCHEKMDPLGLGLENFDPIGKWRDSYGKAPVDPSGVMQDGTKFQGPKELKLLLLKEKEKIARNFSTKLLSYALGRSTLFTDEPALKKLDACLLENNFNPELFLVELVKSYPFLMKLNDFEKKSTG
ncbi:MAG: DUF1592 domain-containing protein [Chitinophagaceae bacterium]|nr:DUF1592 domain-containing protein [Chitinophagaceae bacterium]